MENGKILKIITQAGIGGIALILIGLVWFVIKGQNEIVTNHIQHNTEALIQLDASIEAGNVIQTQQVQVLRDLTEVIRYSR